MDVAAWDERYRGAERLWSEGPNIFVADRLATLAPGVGLDLASGEGRNAVWLAQRGWRMTAVDFSRVALERGRSQSDQVRFVEADVTVWEPDHPFDLIVVAYLHLQPESMRGVVRRAIDWLASGGELFMVGHDRSNIELGHGGPQVPEILWGVDQMRGWLDGVRIVEAQIVRRPVEIDDGYVYARDALIRGRRID